LSAKVFHIPFIGLTKNLVLHSIVQRSPKAGDSAVEDYPDIKHYTAVEPLFQDPEVDVVIISTPPNTHFDLVKSALEHGKHVLVEKPFVPTSTEAHELVALARQQKRVLCVYQNRRWDSDFLTVQKLLGDGTLGRVLEFETHFDRFRPEKPTTWKGTLSMSQGGGVVYDLGSHLLDQVFVLFGVPSAVSAKFVNQREGRLVSGVTPEEEPDSVTAVLTYAKTGLLVHVRMAVISVETKQPRYWVRGTKGSYHKHGLDPQEDQLRAGGKATDSNFGIEDASKAGTLCVAQEGGRITEQVLPSVEPETYRRFYELFGNSIESGNEADVPVPASQAAQVLAIIEAIQESARTGKDVSVTQ
jgi:predicted dehydrogenase